MTNKKIYLDYNATTPCDPQVVEKMIPFYSTMYGNASSKHHPFGWEAKKAVDLSRGAVSQLIGCSDEEIIFTSGATEALNLAIKGIYQAYASKGKHIITCQTEHSAVLDTCEYLEKMGADITYLSVDENGNIDIANLRESIRVDTLAIVIMWANNETGVVHDINAIAEICYEKNVFLVVDGTQAVGKIDVAPHITKIDCMAFSAHKMYGPKGVGALYVNKPKRIKLTPLLHGGGHERGYRSGTLNVPGIVGFGKAAQLSLESLESECVRLSALQSYLESKLLTIENSQINGQKARRLPNTTNILLRFADNEQLLSTFNQNIAVSTGSACSSEDALPSHVLTAMHLTEPQAKSCLRISYGKYTTQEEIDFTVDTIIAGVQKVRTASPKWQMFKQGYDMTEY